MALIKADRVKETTTTTGTDDFILNGAVAGYRSFASVCASGNNCYYSAINQSSGAWETGLGTFTAGPATLQRTLVLASSTGGKVSFGSGITEVLMSVNSGAISEPWRQELISASSIPSSATSWAVYGPSSAGFTIFSLGTSFTNLTSLTFENLTALTNFSTIYSFTFRNFPELQTITAQRLMFANGVNITLCPKLQTVLLSALNNTARISVSNCSLLSSFQCGTFFRYCFGDYAVFGCPLLTSLTASLPSLGIGGNVDVSGNGLTQATVDGILTTLAGYDGTNGRFLYGSGKTVNLSGGTNAAPSATGLAAKDILVARGCTVTHN